MLTSLCPVIRTSRLEESREFYTKLFDYKVTHRTDWYVGLGRPGLTPRELALLDTTHPALPEAQRRPVRMIRFTLEMESGERERIAACGAFAARRSPDTGGSARNDLVVTDPNGVQIRVVAPK
ncbi:VOC family protein [Streptomyces sp. VNUA24]|uniref:VOC family protein n=1 Tax=Streptomyces sp. VNUA24 TaxID=3031131 RepID=UPI0023B7AA66|nr:VOC family protein [Streptomyces sp. VNUA24]WEH12339.1 glyoxalase [Streptomyces sp. VNUA24]